MAKIKNFKQLTGKFTVTVDGRKFSCNNSKLPLYTEVLNMFGKKRHPTACIGIQRHKDVAKAAKLCGIRGIDRRIGEVEEVLQYLGNKEFINKTGNFSVKLYRCENEDFRAKLAEKLNSEFTRIYTDLNPPAPKRKPGRPKGSKNKKTATKSRTSKAASSEVKALQDQVAQLTEMMKVLMASQVANKTESIIADLTNSSAKLQNGNIVTKL